MILERDLAKFSTLGPLSSAWYTFFKSTKVPDEHYFITLQYSWPNAPRGWVTWPMYVKWENCQSYELKPGGHPCDLGLKDLEDIKQSTAMFARKSGVLMKRN